MTAVPPLVDPVVRLTGLAVIACAVAAGVALAYRWYARDTVSEGVSLLIALSSVAIYLNAKTALGDVISGQSAPLEPDAVAFNSAALFAAAVVAPVGRRVGDRLATDLGVVASARELDRDVGGFVRAVGRVVTVDLPAADDIDDIEGYDPVAAETKERLGETTFAFPRRLTVAELHDRLVARLKDDYGVGYVDLEVDAAGDVAYLAVGARVAGVGPTLVPGTAAVAVRADPPNAASPGDVVQLWEGGEDPRHLATAELRAVAGDVVTLALDASDAPSVAGRDCHLVTLPAEPRPEREFAALLRTADETMGTVRIGPESPLVGLPVGAVDVTVVAVRGSDGRLATLPPRDRVLAVGDTLYVVARLDGLRRLVASETVGNAETT